MSLARAIPASALAMSLLSAGVAHAQYRQPWVGMGIPASSAAPSSSAPTRFTIRVENISKGEALELSDGSKAPFISAPVLWVIHTGAVNPIFTGGQPDAGRGLETLAETGDPATLLASLNDASRVIAAGADDRPVGAEEGGPLMPGQAYEFDITAEPGQYLSTAWMFGQSNDLFYANDRPIALFGAGGKPVSGDLTTQLSLWDAGTEVNEEPGLGPNQGPRQGTPDAGTAERASIVHVRDRFTYPRTDAVLRLTVTPAAEAMSSK